MFQGNVYGVQPTPRTTEICPTTRDASENPSLDSEVQNAVEQITILSRAERSPTPRPATLRAVTGGVKKPSEHGGQVNTTPIAIKKRKCMQGNDISKKKRTSASVSREMSNHSDSPEDSSVDKGGKKRSRVGPRRDGHDQYGRESPHRINMEVMTDVLSKKSQREPAMPMDNDTYSVKSVSSAKSNEPTTESLLQILLSKNVKRASLDLVEKTVHVIKNSLMKLATSKRRKVIMCQINYIKSKIVRPDLKGVNLTIDTSTYLYFSNCEVNGLDFNTMKENPGVVERSLLYALGNKCKKEENSLDMVFRNAMKLLSREAQNLEETGLMTVRKPVLLICARYLELRLIDLIREHYLSTLNEDIIEYLSRSDPPSNSRLKTLIEGSVSEFYIRRLRDQYNLSLHNYTKLMEQSIGTPEKMMVWITNDGQVETNTKMLNYISSVYHKVAIKVYGTGTLSPEDKKKKDRDMLKAFIAELRTKTEPTIREYETFLSMINKISELMLWMSFGLTSTDPMSAIIHTGLSYLAIRLENENTFHQVSGHVCWNLPLASKFVTDEDAATPDMPILSYDDFLSSGAELLFD